MTSYPSLQLIPALSVGSLDDIFKAIPNNVPINGRSPVRPIVQILAVKRIPNGSIRCTLWDGRQTCKWSLIKSTPDIERKWAANELQPYAIVRLESYWLAAAAIRDDLPILIIDDLETLAPGYQVKRKVEITSTLPPPAASTTATTGGQHAVNANKSFTSAYSRDTTSSVLGGGDQTMDKSKACPIAAITPFFTDWLIRVRVLSKTAIRTFKGREGKPDGRVFSFDAADHSSDIRITAFNAECDKYYDFIEKDLNYYIHKGSVKTANRKFSNLKSDYEIHLKHDSEVTLCLDDIPVPPKTYRFVPIANLADQPVGDTIDVVGVIRQVDDLQTIVAKKSSKELRKRVVCLVDKSLAEVRLTLWEREAEEFTGTVGQVMAIKNAVVGEFQGRTLSCATNATIDYDPDIEDAHVLKGWYDRESALTGELQSIQPLSKSRDEKSNDWRYLCQINDKTVPPDGQPLYSTCVAMILATNRADRHLYKACVADPCVKKVREENGYYYCDKCGHNSAQFRWRLIISMSVTDPTGDHWVTAFQEVVENMTGRTVNELAALYESDPYEYQLAIQSAFTFRTFQLRIGTKVGEYNGERRLQSTCYDARPLSPIQRSQQLIEFIKMATN